MKRTIIVVLGLALGFMSLTLGAERPAAITCVSGDSESAESVLERYVRACGGEALSAVRTESGKGTLVRHLAGHVPLTVVWEAPGKFVYHQVFAWGDQIRWGFDGTAAWIQTTESIGEMDMAQLLDMRLMFDAQVPLKLNEFFPEMSVQGSEKVGETDAVTVAAKSASGVERELAFDNETGLLARAGDVFFEDYRDVGPVKRPFRIVLGRDQGEEHRRMIVQFSEILHNEEVDGTIFDRPASPLPVVEAPLFKKRKSATPSVDALERCIGIYESPERKGLKFRVFREDGHLFLDMVGRGLKIEILPESDVDYYTKFLGWDFHFIEDDTGRINELVVEAATMIKAIRIE